MTSTSNDHGGDAVLTSTPWRQRPRLRMTEAAEIACLSPASLYSLARDGRLELRKIAGRTVVDTQSLIKLIENDEPWTPSKRGAAARLKRSKENASRWRS